MLEPESNPADLVEVPDEKGMDEKIAKGFAPTFGPGQHTGGFFRIVERCVEGVDLGRFQNTLENKISRHVEGVVFLVGHPVVIHVRSS